MELAQLFIIFKLIKIEKKNLLRICNQLIIRWKVKTFFECNGVRNLIKLNAVKVMIVKDMIDDLRFNYSKSGTYRNCLTETQVSLN